MLARSMILRSMQSFLDRVRVLSDGIAKSRFTANPLLVFEVAHETDSWED